jgi:Salmonella virulence plasmid 65kDa B protein
VKNSCAGGGQAEVVVLAVGLKRPRLAAPVCGVVATCHGRRVQVLHNAPVLHLARPGTQPRTSGALLAPRARRVRVLSIASPRHSAPLFSGCLVASGVGSRLLRQSGRPRWTRPIQALAPNRRGASLRSLGRRRRHLGGFQRDFPWSANPIPRGRAIRYADHGDPDDPEFLVTVTFGYEDRPDPFSNHRAGFEIRTVRRCATIAVAIVSGGVPVPERTYHLGYADPAPLNAASLLTSIALEGLGSGGTESVPPLLLSYREFDPSRRDLRLVPDAELPARPIGDRPASSSTCPATACRTWSSSARRRAGGVTRSDGRFTVPQLIPGAPGGIRLADAGIELVDANGEGRARSRARRSAGHR